MAFMTPSDLQWLREGQAWRWALPPKPAAPWCWFGVRHCRALAGPLWAQLTFDPKRPNWVGYWYTEWLSHAIWRGWC